MWTHNQFSDEFSTPCLHRAKKARSDRMVTETKAQILLVDDNRAARDLLQLWLTSLGYAVHSAADGPAALGLLYTHSADLAVVDLYLPGMNGYALCAELQKHAIPVIVISGAPGAPEREAAFAHGATAFLGKPFELMEIAECIEQIVQAQQKQLDPVSPIPLE